MTYQEFKDNIFKEVASRYDSGANVHISTFTKNNGVQLDGLIISKENQPISPTLYLNDFYPMLEKGFTFEEVTERFIRSYEHAKDVTGFDPNMLSDFSQIKDKVIFKLVNKESNHELLKDVPYISYLDLAIEFAIMLPVQNEWGTILIHQCMLDEWGVSKEELFEYAKTNTYQLMQPECIPMESLVSDMLSSTDKELFPDMIPSFPMFVLTNRRKMNGAGVICYPDLLKNISQELEMDLYILPSSIHEVIIIPMLGELSADYLTDMVRQVNETQVPPDEILSDHAYYYLREKNQVMY